MARTLTFAQRVEQSISKTYHKQIWSPFILAIKKYELIQAGDKIAVCISGGKDSMLLAKLIQLLHRYSDVPFEAVYLCMDPGYNPENRRRIEENAKLLEIPIEFFETNIFKVADNISEKPCYLCARMRRGHLYNRAKELGCNKIALGHHFTDVIETTVLGMFYSSQLTAMLPKLKSKNFEGMELIRPMYCIHEDAVLAWKNYHGLQFIQCACRFVEQRDHSSDGIGSSKRQEIKHLIKELKKTNPEIETNIFNSLHCVYLDTFPGYKTKGVRYSFLDDYDEKGTPEH